MKVNTFPIATNFNNPFDHPALREANIIEIFKDLIRPKARPFDCIQVEVTSHCAAKCSYCPHTTKAAHWNARHMQAHTFVNLWPLLKQVTRVHLQGWGEPLLNPHFFDFVSLARKAGCLVSSTSCGLNLNHGIAKKIVQSGMDVIAFSLAGTDAISNQSRKGADFHKVCENIKLLQQVRHKHMAVHLEVHLAYMLLADNLDTIAKLPELMNELQIHSSVVSTLDYLADPSQSNLAINPHDFHVISKAQTLLQQAAKEAKLHGRHIYYALPGLSPIAQCRENIQKSLYIDADGTIAPCIYLNVPEGSAPKLVYGNVNEENILDIWEKSAFVAFREEHFSGTPIAQCQKCVKKFEILQ